MTFAPGETAKTVSVPITGDALDEPDETFTARLSDPVDGVITRGEGTATIVDDDRRRPARRRSSSRSATIASPGSRWAGCLGR